MMNGLSAAGICLQHIKCFISHTRADYFIHNVTEAQNQTFLRWK